MTISNDNDEQLPLKRILVPLDGSEWSFRAARYAIKIAEMATAKVICVHAVQNPPYTEYAYEGVLIRKYIEDAKMEAQKWFDEVNVIAKKAHVVNMATDTLINVFSVADAIISYAERNNVDLIVMGTKGRTGVKKLLLGSVASNVVSHAKCPVLVVR